VELKKIGLVLGITGLAISLLMTVKNNQITEYQDISVQEFDKALADSDPFVVDVHTPEQQHIKGTDAFIPDTEVKDRLAEFPEDKDKEILVYCRSGNMSITASKILTEAGYTNVKNLVGGVKAWREVHHEVSLTPKAKDLGEVVYGQVVETEFLLTNNTSEDLIIKRVTGSCSCTQPSVEQTEVAAYESIKVKVKFDPAVHKDDSDLGEVTRTIFIETDNINFSKLEAQIIAKVIKN